MRHGKTLLCINYDYSDLVLYPTYSVGFFLVAAGHLLRQKASTYFSRPSFSSLHLTCRHGEITQHYSWDKALVLCSSEINTVQDNGRLLGHKPVQP